MRRVVILFGLMMCMAFGLDAQVGRRHKPLYNVESQEFKPNGWHFAPGLTYAVPFNRLQLAELQVGEDSIQSLNYDPFGKLSVAFSVGRHHLFDLSFLNTLDYGLGYKRLSMGENVVNRFDRMSDNTELGRLEERWSYQRNHVSAYVNVSKWFQIADYHFITSGFGLNVDYNVADNRADHAALLAYGASYPANFWGQLHYKIGYGWKANPRFYILPEVEIPILTMVPTEYGLFSFPALRSSYVPVQFSIKFMWLSKWPLKDCVGKPKKKTGHELWDPKMRRK